MIYQFPICFVFLVFSLVYFTWLVKTKAPFLYSQTLTHHIQPGTQAAIFPLKLNLIFWGHGHGHYHVCINLEWCFLNVSPIFSL